MRRLLFIHMTFLMVFCILAHITLEGRNYLSSFVNCNSIVSAQKINVEGFPDAWNPSMVKVDAGYVFTFRITPHPDRLYISYIGVVLLDDDFEPLTKPQILNTRLVGTSPSQSEDARIFSCDGKLFLIYNDNAYVTDPKISHHRDMYVAELSYDGKEFSLGPATLLFYAEERGNKWQKNWVPFEYKGSLFLSYTLAPHRVLSSDQSTGCCTPVYSTSTPVSWEWGSFLRGGTPAILVDGEYLAFFHSALEMRSGISPRNRLWHYYMGAYTFSAEPPFEITAISAYPLVGPGFYTDNEYDKRVIFPGGIVDCGSYLVVAYGKDDREVWIAKIDKTRLKASLVPIISVDEQKQSTEK